MSNLDSAQILALYHGILVNLDFAKAVASNWNPQIASEIARIRNTLGRIKVATKLVAQIREAQDVHTSQRVQFFLKKSIDSIRSLLQNGRSLLSQDAYATLENAEQELTRLLDSLSEEHQLSVTTAVPQVMNNITSRMLKFAAFLRSV